MPDRKEPTSYVNLAEIREPDYINNEEAKKSSAKQQVDKLFYYMDKIYPNQEWKFLSDFDATQLTIHGVYEKEKLNRNANRRDLFADPEIFEELTNRLGKRFVIISKNSPQAIENIMTNSGFQHQNVEIIAAGNSLLGTDKDKSDALKFSTNNLTTPAIYVDDCNEDETRNLTPEEKEKILIFGGQGKDAIIKPFDKQQNSRSELKQGEEFGLNFAAFEKMVGKIEEKAIAQGIAKFGEVKILPEESTAPYVNQEIVVNPESANYATVNKNPPKLPERKISTKKAMGLVSETQQNNVNKVISKYNTKIREAENFKAPPVGFFANLFSFGGAQKKANIEAKNSAKEEAFTKLKNDLGEMFKNPRENDLIILDELAKTASKTRNTDTLAAIAIVASAVKEGLTKAGKLIPKDVKFDYNFPVGYKHKIDAESAISSLRTTQTPPSSPNSAKRPLPETPVQPRVRLGSGSIEKESSTDSSPEMPRKNKDEGYLIANTDNKENQTPINVAGLKEFFRQNNIEARKVNRIDPKTGAKKPSDSEFYIIGGEIGAIKIDKEGKISVNPEIRDLKNGLGKAGDYKEPTPETLEKLERFAKVGKDIIATPPSNSAAQPLSASRVAPQQRQLQ